MKKKTIFYVIFFILVLGFLTPLVLRSNETRVLSAAISEPRVHASPAYTYYGYAPPSNFSGLDSHPEAGPNFRRGWIRDPITNLFIKDYGHVDNGTCYLDIIGYNDSTTVKIFDVTKPTPVLLESFTINRMELHNTTIPAKTYFKVVSDKPVAVMAGGGNTYGSGFNLFYPSTDGGYAGKEFIFMAIEDRGRTERPAPGTTIHAIEDAHVKIYDDEGKLVFEKTVKANTTRTLRLVSRKVYRAISTGRILLGVWSQHTVKAVPSPMGGFKGTYFFVIQDANTHGAPQWSAMFIINQEKPSHVKIIKIGTGAVLTEKDLNPRELWFVTSHDVDFMTVPVMVTSTNNIILISGNVYSMSPIPVNMWNDVTVIGIRPNDPTTIYVISSAVAFSPEATAKVTVGGISTTIPKGRFLELPGGLITITSNATLIVEIISMPTTTFPSTGEPQTIEVLALDSWGTYLPTAEGVKLTYPKPVVKEEGGMDMLLYGAAAAVAVIVVVGAIFVWKRRSS